MTILRGMKTHCVHGHEYTPENSLVNSAGNRYCRTCTKHPRILKTRGRKWTPQRVARLRDLAEAGVTRPAAALIMGVHYETLRTACEVHQVTFRRDKPWHSPIKNMVRAASLSALLRGSV